MPSLPPVFSARRADDADLIRARLRALLADGRAGPGWVPDDPDGPADPPGPAEGATGWDDDEGDGDDWTVEPVPGRRHLAVVREPVGGRGSRGPAGQDPRETVRLGRPGHGAGEGMPRQAGWETGTGPAPSSGRYPAGARQPDAARPVGPLCDGARPDTGGGGAYGDGTLAAGPGRYRRHDAPGPEELPGAADEEAYDDDDAAAAGRHRAAGAGVRVTPGRTSSRALWVAALVAAVAVGGWSWLSRPAVEPVDPGAAVPVTAPADPTAVQADVAAPPPTTPAVVVVAVVGQVVTPGLVTLPVGSRVADAVAAAGGLLPEADPAGFNAAALLSDGQQVAVGVPGAVAAPVAAGGAGGPAGGPVDLNAATVADLDALPGIGPVLAQRIVDHRTANGPFASVEQLDDVSGIGPALYGEVSPLVTV